MSKELKMLLVEDDFTLRLLVSKQCELLGLRIDLAATGQEALDKMSQDLRYQLVLMDLAMPDMDGIETTQRIREFELRQQRKRVPIVAMTAHSNSTSVKAAGVDDYIQKPVLIDALKAVVSKWVPELLDAQERDS